MSHPLSIMTSTTSTSTSTSASTTTSHPLLSPVVLPSDAAQPPSGLVLFQSDAAQFEHVANEVRALFARVPARKRVGNSDMKEFGVSFRAAESDRKFRIVTDHNNLLRHTVDFVMAASATALPNHADIDRSRLNIIMRRYCKGTAIPPHIDRIDMFAEPVFGAVVQSAASSTCSAAAAATAASDCLYFVHPSNDSDRFVVPERNGMVFLQSGASRYVWKHGVDRINTGDRISITWRWVLPAFIDTKLTIDTETQDDVANGLLQQPVVPSKASSRKIPKPIATPIATTAATPAPTTTVASTQSSATPPTTTSTTTTAAAKPVKRRGGRIQGRGGWNK
jgi:hypothetical protein